MLKLLLDDVPVRDTQLVEQLVEVLTIVSYSSLQRTIEQNVDFPVPDRGGRNAGLQGFLPGQRSTAPHVCQERISERIVEQIVDSPGGGLQDFRPGQSSSASSSSPAGVHGFADETGDVLFFALLPNIKKSAKLGQHSSPRVPASVSSSTLRPCRTPTSGCSSVTPLARPTSGTDAPMRLSGSCRQASRWSGSARGLRREGSGTGTGSPVPVVTLFLLCLLSDGRRV